MSMRANRQQRRVLRLVHEDRGRIAVHDPALRGDELTGFRHGPLSFVLQEPGRVGSRHASVCRFGEVHRHHEKKASIRPQETPRLHHGEQTLGRTVHTADDAAEDARVG